MRFAVIVLCCLLASCSGENTAELILVGGTIYTMDPERPVAEALVVDDGRIVYVGHRKDAENHSARTTRVLDLEGLTVLPGLIDAHGHLMNLGKLLSEVNLIGTASKVACRDAVLERQQQTDTGSWITGRGWDQNDWEEKEFPTWRDLAGTEGSAVYLRRVDGHAAWLNKTALDYFRINRDTADPPGGRFIRDENGDPTGVAIDAADVWMRAQIPKTPLDEQVERVRVAIDACNRYGLTGMHDAGTTEGQLDIYRRLRDRGELSLRIYTILGTKDSLFARTYVERGPVLDAEHLITLRAIKLYADGALGSRGAMLLEPYSDEPTNVGLPQKPRETLARWTDLAMENGFQVCTHAIGDAGNRVVLDVYEESMENNPVNDPRLRIEHAQVIAMEDIGRFVNLGVIPSMQPTHATSDMYWAEDRVGPERIKGAYAWRRLLDAGCVIPCGSDFPVESADPLLGIYAAVSRQDPAGWPEGGWYPDQRMTVYEAIKGFTIDAAYASFEENVKGSIEPGKLADFTIIDTDLFDVISPRDILSARVVYTIVGGKVVYDASVSNRTDGED